MDERKIGFIRGVAWAAERLMDWEEEQMAFSLLHDAGITNEDILTYCERAYIVRLMRMIE